MIFRRGYLLSAFVLLASVAFSGAVAAQRAQTTEDPEVAAARRIAAEFASALVKVQENFAGEVDPLRVARSSISGMLQTLDPHSSYLDPKEFEDFISKQRSRYSGIGSYVGQRDDKVFILSPFEGSPAHRAGIRYGDQIVEINGQSTAGWTSAQVSSKLLGPEGTPVTVKMGRVASSEPVEFKLVRGSVSLPSISNYFLGEDGVGYVALDGGFNTTTLEELRKAMRVLRDQGMTSLVLDLRRNPGGLVDQAFRVSETFLYRGQAVVSLRGRPSVFQSREYVSRNPEPSDLPLVLLISRSTASAAEIVSGALQDHDRAVLVGESTFGKALVQNVFQLSDGSGLTLTTGHYYTPSGRLIQREYAGRSFYDYFQERRDGASAPKPNSDQKQTDGGRAVYGGGGIDPDVQVRIPRRELELQNYWGVAAFHFARALVGGVVPGFSQFTIDHPADHAHILQASDYVVSDKVLAAFRAFVAGRKDSRIDVTRLEKDGEWVKRQIRYEVVTAAYGQETGRQVLLGGDPQYKQALLEIPKARAMADTLRRERVSSRTGELRRD